MSNDDCESCNSLHSEMIGLFLNLKNIGCKVDVVTEWTIQITNIATDKADAVNLIEKIAGLLETKKWGTKVGDTRLFINSDNNTIIKCWQKTGCHWNPTSVEKPLTFDEKMKRKYPGFSHR